MDEARIEAILTHLKDAGIVAILRGQNRNRMIERGVALSEMGCKAIEVTLDSADTLEIISALRKKLPESVIVGVGTLTDLNLIDDCIRAGAAFALSPNHPEGLIHQCHAAGLLAIPGVSNRHELEDAIANGARVAKLFPSTEWDSEQIPKQTIPWIPVGGVNSQNIWQWLDAGAWCVGMGSNLCGSDLNENGEYCTSWVDSEEQVARGIFKELQHRRNDA
jgi:Entner-Doudoroff aldolase